MCKCWINSQISCSGEKTECLQFIVQAYAVDQKRGCSRVLVAEKVPQLEENISSKLHQH